MFTLSYLTHNLLELQTDTHAIIGIGAPINYTLEYHAPNADPRFHPSGPMLNLPFYQATTPPNTRVYKLLITLFSPTSATPAYIIESLCAHFNLFAASNKGTNMPSSAEQYLVLLLNDELFTHDNEDLIPAAKLSGKTLIIKLNTAAYLRDRLKR